MILYSYKNSMDNSQINFQLYIFYEHLWIFYEALMTKRSKSNKNSHNFLNIHKVIFSNKS